MNKTHQYLWLVIPAVLLSMPYALKARNGTLREFFFLNPMHIKYDDNDPGLCIPREWIARIKREEWPIFIPGDDIPFVFPPNAVLCNPTNVNFEVRLNPEKFRFGDYYGWETGIYLKPTFDQLGKVSSIRVIQAIKIPGFLFNVPVVTRFRVRARNLIIIRPEPIYTWYETWEHRPPECPSTYVLFGALMYQAYYSKPRRDKIWFDYCCWFCPCKQVPDSNIYTMVVYYPDWWIYYPIYAYTTYASVVGDICVKDSSNIDFTSKDVYIGSPLGNPTGEPGGSTGEPGGSTGEPGGSTGLPGNINIPVYKIPMPYTEIPVLFPGNMVCDIRMCLESNNIVRYYFTPPCDYNITNTGFVEITPGWIYLKPAIDTPHVYLDAQPSQILPDMFTLMGYGVGNIYGALSPKMYYQWAVNNYRPADFPKPRLVQPNVLAVPIPISKESSYFFDLSALEPCDQPPPEFRAAICTALTSENKNMSSLKLYWNIPGNTNIIFLTDHAGLGNILKPLRYSNEIGEIELEMPANYQEGDITITALSNDRKYLKTVVKSQPYFAVNAEYQYADNKHQWLLTVDKQQTSSSMDRLIYLRSGSTRLTIELDDTLETEIYLVEFPIHEPRELVVENICSSLVFHNKDDINIQVIGLYPELQELQPGYNGNIYHPATTLYKITTALTGSIEGIVYDPSGKELGRIQSTNNICFYTNNHPASYVLAYVKQTNYNYTTRSPVVYLYTETPTLLVPPVLHNPETVVSASRVMAAQSMINEGLQLRSLHPVHPTISRHIFPYYTKDISLLLDGNNATNQAGLGYWTNEFVHVTQPNNWTNYIPAPGLPLLNYETRGVNVVSTRFDVAPLQILTTNNILEASTVTLNAHVWLDKYNPSTQQWQLQTQTASNVLRYTEYDSNYPYRLRATKQHYNPTESFIAPKTIFEASVDECGSLRLIYNAGITNIQIIGTNETLQIALKQEAHNEHALGLPEDNYLIIAKGYTQTFVTNIVIITNNTYQLAIQGGWVNLIPENHKYVVIATNDIQLYLTNANPNMQITGNTSWNRINAQTITIPLERLTKQENVFTNQVTLPGCFEHPWVFNIIRQGSSVFVIPPTNYVDNCTLFLKYNVYAP